MSGRGRRGRGRGRGRGSPIPPPPEFTPTPPPPSPPHGDDLPPPPPPTPEMLMAQMMGVFQQQQQQTALLVQQVAEQHAQNAARDAHQAAQEAQFQQQFAAQQEAHQTAMGAFAAQFAQQQAPPAPPARPPPGVKQFRDMGPRFFDGTTGPLDSEQFIRSTKDDFVAAGVPIEAWVTIAKLQLQGDARLWWDAEERRLPAPIVWQTFEDRFDAKFFPINDRQAFEKRFVDLEQGDRTVEQYDAEFSLLSRFVPGIVADPGLLLRRYRQGLDPEIRQGLLLHVYHTQDAMCAAARSVEDEIKLRKEREKGKATVTRSSIPPTHSTSFKRQGQSSASSSRPPARASSSSRPPYCFHCEREGHLPTNCWHHLGLCLRCGSADHKIATCPRPVPDGRPTGSQSALAPTPVGQRAPGGPSSQQRGPAASSQRGQSQRGPSRPPQRNYQNRQHFEISAEENEVNGMVITG